MNEQIQEAYDRAHLALVLRGLDEEQIVAGMQKAYARIDAAMKVKPRGAANTERRNA